MGLGPHDDFVGAAQEQAILNDAWPVVERHFQADWFLDPLREPAIVNIVPPICVIQIPFICQAQLRHAAQRLQPAFVGVPSEL